MPASDSFPTTRWSRLLADSERESRARHDALELLARRYWRPIAAYVRARLGQGEDEAREATQAFFVWMLETGFLDKARPERGSFRGFVKRCVANFLVDRERERSAEKRGGGRAALSLDDADLPPLPDPGKSPEEQLDDLWRAELLTQAVAALEEELLAKGKRVAFELFRERFLDGEELDYAAQAARHGITPVDVSNGLALAKRRYRAHLRSCVLDTVGGDEDLRRELAWLLAKDAER